MWILRYINPNARSLLGLIRGDAIGQETFALALFYLLNTIDDIADRAKRGLLVSVKGLWR